MIGEVGLNMVEGKGRRRVLKRNSNGRERNCQGKDDEMRKGARDFRRVQ